LIVTLLNFLYHNRVDPEVSPMRILVAATDLQLLAAMRQGLSQAGHEVVVAGDGMNAWSHLTLADRPDLLVTDIHLGAGTPPGTALGLRAQSHDPRIPVIYTPADARQAIHADPEHGAVLTKPFAVPELVATVHRLLTRQAECVA
jgi:DNA-binding response OmpR family regulator